MWEAQCQIAVLLLVVQGLDALCQEVAPVIDTDGLAGHAGDDVDGGARPDTGAGRHHQLTGDACRPQQTILSAPPASEIAHTAQSTTSAATLPRFQQ